MCDICSHGNVYVTMCWRRKHNEWELRTTLTVIHCIVLYSSVYNYTFCVQHCSEIHMQWHKIMNEYTQKNVCCVQLYICVHFAVVKFICSDTCKMMNTLKRFMCLCCTSWGTWLRPQAITVYKIVSHALILALYGSKLLAKIFIQISTVILSQVEDAS